MSIIVVPTTEGKFRVLIDYIQRGIDYSSQVLAEQNAKILRTKIFDNPRKKLA